MAPPREGSPPGPLELAGFPMLPFAGRIGGGRFDWNGTGRTAAPVHAVGGEHALHGVGWVSEWRAEPGPDDSGRGTLTLDHEADDRWPWGMRLEQRAELTADTLSITLSVTNEGVSSMPAGLGWHPYFVAKNARLMVQPTNIWDDGNEIAESARELRPAERFGVGRVADNLEIDHAFAVERLPASALALADADDGAANHMPSPPADVLAAIRYDDGVCLLVRADPVFDHLIVYRAPGSGTVCVEPINHPPNAHNMDGRPGLVDLAPGKTLRGTVRLTVGGRL